MRFKVVKTDEKYAVLDTHNNEIGAKDFLKHEAHELARQYNRQGHTGHYKNHHSGIIDLGESKGFYYGTKEKKRTGFGEIDYDFGLKI